MPTTLSPTDLCNLALSKIGAQPIESLTDQTSQAAITCNTNWQLAYLEVSRAARWNCLLTPVELVQVPQTPLPDCGTVPIATAWAPNTAYAANVYVTYGAPPYYYQVMFAYTSTASFANDLTTGALVQTNLPVNGDGWGSLCGGCYASGWAFQYALPSDYQLLAALNDTECLDWNAQCGDAWEIMGLFLYTNASRAVIKYVKNQPDTTQFDALFASALTCKLAAMIATPLRQDGGKMEGQMLQAYEMVLSQAMQKSGGEARRIRPQLVFSSRFVNARFAGGSGYSNG